jgi:GNAT superfamily N-acetyltransferase
VALDGENQILGSIFIKPTQPSLGDHIANAGFMVSVKARGRGLGRQLGEFAIPEAKRLGFTAMQFNYVVASNEGAVKLWLDLGFEIIGTVPGAFRHLSLGPIDIHIMHRVV